MTASLTISQPLASLRASSCPTCESGKVGLYLTSRDWFNAGKEVYELLRCSNCGFVWLHNPPPPDEMSRHYGAAYHGAVTASGEGGGATRWRIPLRRLLQYKSGGNILDVGCSSGAFLSCLDTGRWTLFGIEIAAEVADRAKELTGATVFAGDVLAAPFRPESFDAITCFHFLEHVYEPGQVLLRFFEWLKPGGVLYIAVPNIESWEARIFRQYWFGLELPRHLSHFSSLSLQLIARSAGFEIEEIGTPPSSYAQESIRYVWAAFAERLGHRPNAWAPARRDSVPLGLRVLRKGFRLSLLEAFRQSSALAGKAAQLETVLRRPQRRALKT